MHLHKITIITMENIQVTPNYQKRTFTIRKDNGSKYRTMPMPKLEFEENLENTAKDWANWLNVNDCYKLINP